MSQKNIGRPVSPHSKHTMFRVRLDNTSMEKLDECAEELNITRSKVVRKGIDKVHDRLKEIKGSNVLLVKALSWYS